MADTEKDIAAIQYARYGAKLELEGVEIELATLTGMSANTPEIFGPVQALRDHVRRLKEHLRTLHGE